MHNAFARSGWHLPYGVAVTSQILCISITLNKKIITILNFQIYLYNLHPAFLLVNHFIDFLFSSSVFRFLARPHLSFDRTGDKTLLHLVA